MEYEKGEPGYQGIYAALGGKEFNTAFERAITSELIEESKQGQCVEFIYNEPQHLDQGSVTRGYDRLFFAFSGSLAGEMVLGMDGGYLSGTYRMNGSVLLF